MIQNVQGNGRCFYYSAAVLAAHRDPAQIDENYKALGLDAVKDQQRVPYSTVLQILALGARMAAGDKVNLANEAVNSGDAWANSMSQAALATLGGFDIVTVRHNPQDPDAVDIDYLQNLELYELCILAEPPEKPASKPAIDIEEVIPSFLRSSSKALPIEPFLLASQHYSALLVEETPDGFIQERNKAVRNVADHYKDMRLQPQQIQVLSNIAEQTQALTRAQLL